MAGVKGYDVTVELDTGAQKKDKYSVDNDLAFPANEKEAYISLTKLADSLELSSVGDGNEIKFYKTNDLRSYVSMRHGERDIIINEEHVKLTSPVYIYGRSVYVPISFFAYYTNGLQVYYDRSTRIMSVLYEINEELSTPNRKVLEEFTFSVSRAEGIEELTEEEWFEYVGNRG